MEDLLFDLSGIIDGVLYVCYYFDLNLGEEMLNDRRNNVINVFLFFFKLCFFMSWRR